MTSFGLMPDQNKVSGNYWRNTGSNRSSEHALQLVGLHLAANVEASVGACLEDGNTTKKMHVQCGNISGPDDHWLEVGTFKCGSG